MSLLMATTILALGGLGLYMYKSDDKQDGDNNTEQSYNEDSIFGSNFWGSNKEDDDSTEENDEKAVSKKYAVTDEDNYDHDTDIVEENFTKRRPRGRLQTKRNKRSSGTKRRY